MSRHQHPQHPQHQESSDEEDRIITIRPRGGRGGRGNKRQQPRTDPVTPGTDEEVETGSEPAGYKGWVKTKPSKQDEINAHPEQIKQKLLQFERVPPEKYETVDTGTYIRYVRYDADQVPKLRLGGYLIKNGYPDYWILKAGSRGRRPITWSVPLKGNIEKGIPSNEYYTKRGILHNREDRTRYGLEVYDALKSGRYMLVETKTLEGLTGQLLPGRKSPTRRSTARSRFELEDAESEEDPAPRIRARFRDESSDDWST